MKIDQMRCARITKLTRELKNELDSLLHDTTYYSKASKLTKEVNKVSTNFERVRSLLDNVLFVVSPEYKDYFHNSENPYRIYG